MRIIFISTRPLTNSENCYIANQKINKYVETLEKKNIGKEGDEGIKAWVMNTINVVQGVLKQVGPCEGKNFIGHLRANEMPCQHMRTNDFKEYDRVVQISSRARVHQIISGMTWHLSYGISLLAT